MQWNAAISWMADATWARVAPPEPTGTWTLVARREQFLIHACLAPVARRCASGGVMATPMKRLRDAGAV